MAQSMVMATISSSTGKNFLHSPQRFQIRCSTSSGDEESSSPSTSGTGVKLGRAILATIAAGIIIAAPSSLDTTHGTAIGAPSGGRIGGQSFRSAPRMPRSAPPPRSGPRINNSRTNIYVNPGYGYGGYGGFGNPFFSPFSYFFAPPAPAVAVGVGGFDFVPLLLGFILIGWISRALRGRRDDDQDDDY